jgi:hypothetical protein
MNKPFKCIECGAELDEDADYCGDCYEAAYGEDEEYDEEEEDEE